MQTRSEVIKVPQQVYVLVKKDSARVGFCYDSEEAAIKSEFFNAEQFSVDELRSIIEKRGWVVAEYVLAKPKGYTQKAETE